MDSLPPFSFGRDWITGCWAHVYMDLFATGIRFLGENGNPCVVDLDKAWLQLRWDSLILGIENPV